MKKIVTLSVLLFSICTFYWACKKDQTATVNKNLSTEEQQLIANAKTYFENNVQHTNEGQRLSDVTDTIPGQFNPVKSLIKNAAWNEAYTIKLSIGKIVVVPIKFNDSLYARLDNDDSSTRSSLNTLTKLIAFTDSTKQMHVEVVTGFADNNFIKNPLGPFSGVALVQDWQGKVLREYQYQDGKTTRLSLNGNLNNNKVATNSVISPDLVRVTCTEVDWYTCGELSDGSVIDCHYTGTKNLGCSTGDNDDNNNGGPSGGDYGNVSHGGGGGSNNRNAPAFSSLDTIGNHLTNPCFSNALNTLVQNGLKNEITKILLSTFGVNDQINVIFQDSTSISDKKADAKTIPQDGGSGTYGSFYDIITTLSDQQLSNASKEFITETIFHEILHGYLDANGSLQNELSQHITMIKSYVDCEVSALQEIFPKLNIHDAQCLVIGGFGDIQENNPTILNNVLSAYKLTLNDVAHTDSSYKYGNKGIPCN